MYMYIAVPEPGTRRRYVKVVGTQQPCLALKFIIKHQGRLSNVELKAYWVRRLLGLGPNIRCTTQY